MQQKIHNISIRVFEKNPEKIEQVIKIFNEILPIDFKKEKIKIDQEKTEGLQDEIINILTLNTQKSRHNKLILSNLFKRLNENDLEKLYKQRHTRLDAEGNFYIRLDKKSLLEKKFRIVEHGDCFHFRIKIAAFPKNTENLKKSLEDIFQAKLKK